MLLEEWLIKINQKIAKVISIISDSHWGALNVPLFIVGVKNGKAMFFK